MSRDERSKPVLCISFDFWYYLYCMESYKKNHVCDVINLILYSNFVFTICVKYWEDSWKTIISDLHKTIFINYPISAQKFIFQIFCWNFRQRCLLGSLRAELYWIFYITMFSYFFLSEIARTLKYAWAVPVGICYTIKYLYFTGRNPLLSAD